MALLHKCVNGFTGYECVYRQITLDCKKKISTSSNRRERPLIMKTGCGTTEIERERQMDIKREKEGGIEDAVFYENEDKSLIDVENVETTGERCCHLS